MRKICFFCLLLLPLFGIAQEDYSYTITFRKCIVYTNMVGLKADSIIKTGEWTLDNKPGKMTIYSRGVPAIAYPVLFRGLDKNGLMIYAVRDKLIDIQAVPIRPWLRIVELDKVIVYQ